MHNRFGRSAVIVRSNRSKNGPI